jgi:predicted nucleic acid-binding protein
MLVVSDTSPLSNLAIIGRLDLLREQFGEVLMPPAVAHELSDLRNDPAQQLLLSARQDGWLKTKPLPATAPSPPELHDLDPGETEALRLALAISADGVLMDEKEGRQCAALLGVRTIGVLGVLLAARRSGVISALRPEMERLHREAGFFIDAALEKQVLETAGEQTVL